MERLVSFLIEQDAERQWKRMEAFAHKRVVQHLNARLMADRRIGIWLARLRLRGIDAMLTVHAVELLGFTVIGLELVVSNRPGRRETAVMPDLAEVLLAQAKERRPIHLRVAPDIVMNAGMERTAVAAVPGLLGHVSRFHEDFGSIPVLALARQIIATLQEQDALARGSESVSERSTPRPAADDDDVVVIHGTGPSRLLRARCFARGGCLAGR